MPTAQQIAEYVGAPAHGPSCTISRVSAIDAADGEALVFATDQRSLAQALASAAGLIFAPAAIQPSSPVDRRLVWVKDARLAFARAARLLAPPLESAGVHPSAVLGEDVSLGCSVRIGPGVVVGKHVRIGDDCVLEPRVTVYRGTQIGARVRVQAGAVLGSTGFGYVRDPETGEYLAFPQQGRLVIEDDVEIGANSTIDRGALGETRIGRGSKLDNLVHVGHNVRIGQNVIVAAQTGISGSSVIEDGAIIAGQVGIAEHVTIGTGVILGAKCGVPTGKTIRGAGEVFWGIPARPIREYLRDLAKLRRS